jgi:hypothetical protein
MFAGSDRDQEDEMGIFEDTDIISSYSREQAIEDGVLVDVSRIQRLFKFPVALTRAVWADCVEWPESEGAHQDQTGRLHDVLWMTFCAVRRGGHTDRVDVEVLVVPRGGTRPGLVRLEAVCGPGDEGEPVITIQYHGED